MPVFPDPQPSAMSREAFVARFGGVYEHSPWVAERAFDKGLDSGDDGPADLSSRMRGIVEAAGEAAWLTLLRAHPELAGKLAVAGGLTMRFGLRAVLRRSRQMHGGRVPPLP